MAVNTAALKTFAPAMRRQLMEAVGRKLDLLLNSQTPDTLSTYAKQIAELRDEQEKSREQLLERVAYTWFNRLCALRYLDAKGWHPFGCKVLMPADGSETQPELLKLMRSGSLPGDLKSFTNEQRLNQLLDGQIPTAIPGGDAQGEVYRELVLAACRSYHHLLPDLFEGLDDATELLLPDDLLTEGSIAGSFRSAITDSDCDDVEIIGWLYQFYISEKKDEVIGKVVKSEDIPAATQLFTPNWIVKYMVQNTIGAQWLATYPDSPLREQMEFYIEPAEQTDEVKAKLAEITPTSLNPEELTLMDPACGSGHILVEAYETFKAIYLEQGYQLREIPALVFEKNLFGLDIDQRAVQLASFSLIMKGRADDRRLFDRGINLNVIALQDSKGFEIEGLVQQINLSGHGIQINALAELKQLFKDATTFGSLVQVPERLKIELPALTRLSKLCKDELLLTETLQRLELQVKQAQLLASEYDAVVANPPYMGSGGMNPNLKLFTKKNYPQAKSDLFACFVERGFVFAKRSGHTAMITMQSWMFLSSFEKMRKDLLQSSVICSMAHLGARAFGSISGEVVQTSAFVLKNNRIRSYRPTFFQLLKGGEDEKSTALKKQCHRHQEIMQYEFLEIPGSPIIYSAGRDILRILQELPPFDLIAPARCGMNTGDNARFVRHWAEVPFSAIGLRQASHKSFIENLYSWVPYNKGGAARRWYGNCEHLLKFDTKSHKELGQMGNHLPSEDYYFRPSLSWTKISSTFTPRYYEEGFVFDGAGSCAFPEKDHIPIAGAFLCSSTSAKLMGMRNPTTNFQSGDVASLPFDIFLLSDQRERLEAIFQKAVYLTKNDWNSYERSWDFQSFPFIGKTASLVSGYSEWITRNKEIIYEMKSLEESNNLLFINAYGLTDDLSPCVSIDQITLTINPAYRYGGDLGEEEKWQRFQSDSMAELLSYATGCMMGRYSLDYPGLILADSRNNQDDHLAAYEAKVGKPISEIQFKPDADAIIPVLDGEWFEDDIVARTREFLKVTFPESSVAESLRFIEDSIGKDIRKYFCKDFYKDHLQTYKKRPIYWMVQSPKAGFACLIYLHRYTPDTLLQVLNNYFRPYLQKLEARQEQLERDQNNDALPKREQTAARKEAEKITKVLKECQTWEQDALMPLAQRRIPLDLDDGVKVNYLKLQEVLARIPGLAAKGD